MTLWKAQQKFEVDYFSDLLTRYNGVLTSVAEEAGIHRNTCARKLKLLGLIERGRSWTERREFWTRRKYAKAA